MIIGLEYLPRRAASSPPLLLALPFDRGPYSPPRCLSYPLFRFFHLFTSLPSHLPFTPSPLLQSRFGSRHPSSPMRASLGYCPSTRSLYSTLFIYRTFSGYIFLSRVGCEYGALCEPLRSLACLLRCKQNSLFCDYI